MSIGKKYRIIGIDVQGREGERGGGRRMAARGASRQSHRSLSKIHL